ncbi:MAG: DUF4296 domain-containing protein [Candidatus Cryptobacteroides sp.]
MRSRFLISGILLLCVLSSCRREGRIIPRSKMTKIYVEMFIADQRIASSTEIRRTADTSWVYEPIFEKYGYNSDDYRASVAHYMKDPDRYARILRESGALIDSELKEMRKEKKRLESLEQMKEKVEVFNPERIYRMTSLGNPGVFCEDSLAFYVDSAGGELYFDPRDWMDTAFYGPVMRIADSVLVQTDSLSKADSLSGEPALPEVAPVRPVEATVLTGKSVLGKPVPEKSDAEELRQDGTVKKDHEAKEIKPEKLHRDKRPVREIENL